jgi:hypothetical protein
MKSFSSVIQDLDEAAAFSGLREAAILVGIPFLA